MNVAELQQQLALRIRGETSGATYSTELGRRILSLGQQVLSIGSKLVITSGTLPVEKQRQIFPIRDYLADVGQVLAVRDGNRDLDFMTNWRELLYSDRSWFRRIGPKHKSFALVGHDLIIVHPARPINTTLTVVYSKLTTEFTSEGDTVELPDDDTPKLLELAEALLLLRERRLDSISAVVSRLVNELANEQG